MMEEITLQILAVSKLLSAVMLSALYAVGGMANKWIRRFLMPGLLLLFLGLFSLLGEWHWLYAGTPAIICIGTTLGYGADKFWMKVLKRTLIGVVFGTACIPIALVTGQWSAAILHFILCVSSMMLLGVWNPFTARAEETMLGFIFTITPLMMI